MILQSLTELYDRLVEKGELEQPGWQEAKVSWALELREDGSIMQAASLMKSSPDGKKKKPIPANLKIPAQVKRTVGIAANFLCDNSSYILGVDAKGKPERAKECFEECRKRHIELLKKVDAAEAQAVVRFFESWDPERAQECEAIKDCWEDLISGGNIVFMVNDEYVHDISEVRAAWNNAYCSNEGGEVMRCLVTGEESVIARLHPSIKGVRGAQSSGASLVSFNAPAYDSFGRDGGQGSNAPVSERAAFAYGAALNYLISKPNHRTLLGDMTVVFWAEDAQEEMAACFGGILGGDDTLDEKTLSDIVTKLSQGKQVEWDDVPIDPSNRFYILALSPNAARLSVRFFIHDSFGEIVRKISRHYDDIKIVKPKFDPRENLSVWSLLNETVNQKSKDKSASPQMAGALLRAVLTGGRYPSTLLTQTEMRIRAEHEVTRGKAAIIKAYLLRNGEGLEKYPQYKEVLRVKLNEDMNYQPYVLGRLFAVLEALQEAANPNINTTIRDRYFNSACSTPAVVFPQLIRLAQAHLKKLSEKDCARFQWKIKHLMDKCETEYPARLDLHDQGIFQIGYYHQLQKRYETKEEK